MPQIAGELVRALTEGKKIEVINDEEVRLDFEAVLKEYIRRDRGVTDEAKRRMEREGLSHSMLGRIKSQVAKEQGVPPRDEQLPYLVDQVMTMIFHSNNVDEVWAEDHILRKAITAAIRRHTGLEDELDKEVRAKIKNLSEGTANFDVEYAKVMDQIKQRRGVDE